MLNKTYPAKILVPWFWRTYVRSALPLILIATVFMTFEGGAVGALSYMVRPMFDQVFVSGDAGAVYWVAFIVAAIFIGRAIAGFCQRVLMAAAGRRISAKMQNALMQHMVFLDSRFFQENSPGLLMDRVRGDTEGAVGIVSNTFSALGRDVIALISLLAVAVSIDWVWTLFAVAGAPIILLPVLVLQRIIRATSRIVRETSARLSTRLDEIFHGINTIKLNATETHETRRFATDIAKFVAAQLKAIAAQAGIPALMDLVAAIGFFGVLVYGGFQIIEGQKTIGEFMSFFTAIALVFEPIRRLGALSGAWQAALISLERVYSVFEQQPTITSPDHPKALSVPAQEADIEFLNVAFSYGENPVLQDVTFTARAGQTTAIVGASGAGKSTVFNVLTRLVDCDTGSIMIGGTATNALDLGDLRQMFSVVTQDTQLFDETVSENVLLGQDVSEAQLNAALEAANVADFLPNLSDGVDTPVGPRGVGLSGGQRQRVAIARALLRDTPFLLLDEATSALDSKSETVVQAALERLSAGRTTLVIAHRLSTVRRADKIVVMDHGRVVEQGTHNELLKQGGIYANLYHIQFAETD